MSARGLARASSQPEAGPGRRRQGEPGAREEVTARQHRSVSFRPPLSGDRLVILADLPVVARQERLRVGIRIHLRPQRLGQVPPDVLVRLGVNPVGPLLAGAAAPGLHAAVALLGDALRRPLAAFLADRIEKRLALGDNVVAVDDRRLRGFEQGREPLLALEIAELRNVLALVDKQVEGVKGEIGFAALEAGLK